jgi:glycosyltransferase involved in cell wall biosynthesis
VLRKSNHSITFLLIGEVHCHVCLGKIQKFISENGMQDHVLLTDRQDNMPAVMASLDILVSLSGGSVMFEAMAAGKAVISAGFTTKEYSFHIQDGRTGLLIESQEAADLSQAIIKLVETPELRNQLGLEARKWAVKELTHKKMVEKTRQLYDTLLSEARKAGSNG